ncbi:MAG: OsmC family protein [Ignavibacteria bacterium]|nr:OsmC family protein [Ignavibacteria bacterium]
MTESKNTISISNSDGFKTEIISRGHSLISDEPIESNGRDEGMTPYELLLSALGACKAITVRMYAQKKDIPLKNILINLSHKKIHSDDCLDYENKECKIDDIEVEIELTGDLNDEQRKRLIEISEMCPVHKTLTSVTKINSSLTG